MPKFYAACARAFALAIFAVAVGALSSIAQAQQSGDRHQGILTVRWGDPHPSVKDQARGNMVFHIVYPNGARVPLDVPPELANEAIQHSGKRVTVRGSAAESGGVSRIRVNSIEAPATTREQAEFIGTKKVLFILVRFKQDTQTPHPAGFFLQMTNPLTSPSAQIPATINGFFAKVSYGQFKWVATVAGNKWFNLPRTRAQYCLGNCGPNGADINLDLLGDDAVALAVAAGVNVNSFHNINFVVNNDLDCCAWGGTYSNGTNSFGATWEPPWGQEPGVYVHEMGHSLGLPHSGWRYHAYDSQHDQMSDGVAAASVLCGVYTSVNFGGPNTQLFCDKPGGGFIMAHQNHLGWIPAANKKIHNFGVGVAKEYVIEANSLPLSNRAKLVIVCITGKPCAGGDGSAARFVTIEVKLRVGDFDNGIPSQGVVIHDVMMNRPNISGNCYFNNQSGWALPFDAVGGDWNATSCTGNGLANMAYGVNKSLNNAALGVKVEVLSKTGPTFRVRVTKTK